jgi:signal transduction histidine kinase
VEDNGPGIPPEIIDQIFDAFVTTRLDARGTGLGLTVAEGIVNQHGGTLTAANRAAGGACLEVRLPCPVEEKA